MPNQSRYDQRPSEESLSSTSESDSADGQSQPQSRPASAGSKAAHEALTAMSTMQLPTSLQSQPKMMEAVRMVCEQGVSRSLAAYKCDVSAVALGVVIKQHGLKRGPPASVRKALAMIANGVSRAKAERIADVTKGRSKFWMNRMNTEAVKQGPAVTAVKDGLANNLTPMETAQKHGLCYGSIIRAAGSMGVKLRRPDRYRVTARDQDILDMRASGAKLREIGVKHGISMERVRQIIHMEKK